MSTSLEADTADVAEKGLSRTTTAIFAVACGAMVSNLYFAQPLIGLIGPDLRLTPAVAGIIVTLTQLGYGAGLMFLVSLADLVENRKLALLATAGVIVGLLGAAFSHSAAAFLTFSFLVGFCSVGAQVLVPLAAHLTPEGTRGRVIGNIMAGLLAGVMLARPFASFVAANFGWRAVFWISAIVMAAIMVLLWSTAPRRQPKGGVSYGAILRSTARLMTTLRPLQRRAAYQGVLFAAFNLFWTAVPLMLRDAFHLSQNGIAVFALMGAGGALAAPIAGRLADRGYTRVATRAAMIICALAFFLSGWAGNAKLIIALAVAAITLDAAVQLNQVMGQRFIYGLGAEIRGRLNAAYMTCMFVCGATGSALAAFLYTQFGWIATVLVGAALALAVLAFAFTEPADKEASRAD